VNKKYIIKFLHINSRNLKKLEILRKTIKEEEKQRKENVKIIVENLLKTFNTRKIRKKINPLKSPRYPQVITFS